MRRCAFCILALFVLAAMGVQAASAQDKLLDKGISDQPSLVIMQAGQDEADDGSEVRRIWNSYVENIDYQGDVLNRVNQQNASNESFRDAMVAFTALFILNTQGLSNAESITPDEEYRDFYNYTINSMKYFNVYLYNMAKLFETRNVRYSTVGREAFNISVEYYELGKAEADFLF